jgi:hypothetical protein
MKNDIDKTIQRTQRYWYIDGLTEIAFGAYCLLLGVYFYLQITAPEGTFLSTFLSSALVFVLVGGALLVNQIVKTVKTRLTFPRTGYVSFPQKTGKNRWMGAALAIFMGAVVAAMFATAPQSYAWMPAVSGLVFGLVLIGAGVKLDLIRFYLLASISVILGAGLSIAGIGNIQGLAYFYGLVSLPIILSGLFTLSRYLRQTQPLEHNGEAS